MVEGDKLSGNALISIIVPIYNASKYLSECLDSLVGQTINNLEIICIDDGSTDKSLSIVESYAAIDRRVHVYLQPNSGVAAARNRGLDQATGKYVLFVDADDFISLDACETLLKAADDSSADIVVFGGKTFPTTEWADASFAQRDKVYSHKSLEALFSERGSYPLMCNKLYLRDLLELHKVRFNENLKLGEDHAFQLTVFPYADTVAFVKEHIYFYRGHTDSVVVQYLDNHDEKVFLHFRVVESVVTDWANRGLLEPNEKKVASWAIGFLYGSAAQCSFNIRARFSNEFVAFMNEWFSAETLKACEKNNKYRFMCDSRKVIGATPHFTVVLDRVGDCCDFEKTYDSLVLQTDQFFEALILPPENEDAAFSESVNDILESDERFRLLSSRDCNEIFDHANGRYFLRMTFNEAFEEAAFKQITNVFAEGARGTSGEDCKDVEAITFFDSANLLNCKDPYSVINITSGYSDKPRSVVSADQLGHSVMRAFSLAQSNKIFSLNYLDAIYRIEGPRNIDELYLLAELKLSRVYLTTIPLLNIGVIGCSSTGYAYQIVKEVFSSLKNAATSSLVQDQPSYDKNDFAYAYCLYAFAWMDLVAGSRSFEGVFNALKEMLSPDLLERALSVARTEDKQTYDFLSAFASSEPDAFFDYKNEFVLSNMISVNRKNLKDVGLQAARADAAAKGKKTAEGKIAKLRKTYSWRIGRAIAYVPSKAKKALKIGAKGLSKSAWRCTDALSAKMPNHMPKVSVVVPVYNVSKYLPECLDSLIGQTLKDMEIICVNDGSTDDSLDILQKYQKLDSRIKIITKENRGYGHTMNMGFRAARGEYIGILESDDFAELSMYEELYKFAHKHKLDLVKANYYEHSEDGDKKINTFAGREYRKVFSPEIEQDALTAAPIIWSALYRRALIDEHGVHFNETPGASYQDTSFVFQVWACSKRVALLPNAYIHYRVDNENSSVKSSAKVFAVCSEYELSTEFLKKDEKRFATFAPIMNLLKWGTYRWNYNRISEDCHQEFAQRMSQEYREANASGTLVESYFDPTEWRKIQLLMKDPKRFASCFRNRI